MTSGTFQSIPVSSIIVNRGDRQRTHLTNIEELAESIQRVGLINAIVVNRDFVLVAGERRLTAVRSLGWTHISAQFAEDLPDYELQCIEFDENIKREDLPWQDRARAIDKFHQLKMANEEEWTQAQTAAALGHSEGEVAKQLQVAAQMTNPQIATAATFSVAYNLTAREAERKKHSVLAAVQPFKEIGLTLMSGENGSTEEVIVHNVRTPPLICADFHEWAAGYAGEPFNLLHCDFPYGINVTSGPRQHSAIQETYDDSEDVYWSLLQTLEDGMTNVVAPSAHMIFWFSMHFYQATMNKLMEIGWNVSPFPLIWHKSDNAGVAPDPQRQPRRTYETAFFCTRGDRKLTAAGAKANSFSYPGGQKEIHLSEKPVEMLRHFLSLVCDEYSTVLDPTCGSGNALKAASVLGANSVLGIEKSEDFYATAVARYWGDTDVDA